MYLADDEDMLSLFNDETEQTQGARVFFLRPKVVDVDTVRPALC